MRVCEECGCRVATIHFMQINGADQKSLFLCEECARNQGIPVAAEDAADEGSAIDDNGDSRKVDMECPSCDMALSEFSRTGRLGCPECYVAFAPDIEALHREVHGSDPYTGKKYRAAVFAERSGDLKKLGVELAAAIKNEEFERAALLRDAILNLHRPEHE